MTSLELPYFAGAMVLVRADSQTKAGLLPVSFSALQHVTSMLLGSTSDAQTHRNWDTH